LRKRNAGEGAAETARSVTDAHLTDQREKELSDLGFIPLCHTPGAAEAAYYSTPSAQKPKGFDTPVATATSTAWRMRRYWVVSSSTSSISESSKSRHG